MAFKGGFYRKPVNIDFDGVVGLYTAGKARAEQTREGVRKERGEQLKLLSEASDFEISGIEDFDQLIQGTANNARSVLLDAHKANIAGEGTRSMSAAETSNQSTQMQMLGKMSEMTAKKIEETKKLVEKGEASQAQLDNIYATFFQDAGQKLLITDADGKQRTADRTLTPVMMKDSRGRIKHGVKVKQEYVDQDGSLRQFEGFSSIADIVNPRDNFIKQKTVISVANEFIDGIGKREFVVGPDGVEHRNDYYKQVASGPNGQRFLMRPIAPEMFADVRNTIENNIGNLNDNDYVAMIKSMGGGTVTDAGFKGYRPVEQVNQAYGRLYDDEGNGISFESDPLVIMRNEDMSYNISEDNKKVVNAYIRDNVYKGMDVSSEELRTGQIGGRGSTTTEAGPITDIKYMGEFENGTRERELSAEHLFSIAKLNQSAVAVTDIAGNPNQSAGGLTPQDFVVLRNQFNKTGLLQAGTGTDTNYIDIFAIKNADGQYDFENVNAHGKNIPLLNDEVGKNKTLDIDSLSGQEFSTASGIVVVDKNGQYSVHIVGDVEVASLDNLMQSAGGTSGGQTTSKMGMDKQLTVQGISQQLTSGQARSLWAKLYSKDLMFASWAKTNGYGSNPSAIDIAWQDFSERYK
jgi:hypothetical protein